MRGMKLWLLKRGYLQNVVDHEIEKVEFYESSRRTNKWNKGVCLVVLPHITHYFKTLAAFSKKSWFNLHWWRSCKNSTPRRLASFRSARKIRSYLTVTKLYPLESRVGSFKYGGRRCQICLNVTETETFTSTNQVYQTNHESNCNESSQIYLLTCKICCKKYIRQTVDIIPSRWNNYKNNDRKYLAGDPVCKNNYLTTLTVRVILAYFEKVFVTLNDKTDSQNPEKKQKTIAFRL